MPTINEWDALVDPSNWDPALPSGYPFTNVQSSYYWSSTANNDSGSYAWVVFMMDGSITSLDKGVGHYSVWPVRSAKTVSP